MLHAGRSALRFHRVGRRSRRSLRRIQPIIEAHGTFFAGFPTLREVVLIWAVITDADSPTAIAGVLRDFVVWNVAVIKVFHCCDSLKQSQPRACSTFN